MALSKDIVKQLNTLFPSVPNIGANVIELKNENYYNKNMLNREGWRSTLSRANFTSLGCGDYFFFKPQASIFNNGSNDMNFHWIGAKVFIIQKHICVVGSIAAW